MSAAKLAPERPELKKLLDWAREVGVTEDQLRAQRASFVYGNAPKGSRITRKSAEEAAHKIRIT
jgi:hypothetical protein